MAVNRKEGQKFSVAVVVPTWHYFANPFKLHPLHELYFATMIDFRFQGKDVSVRVIDLREVRSSEGGLCFKKLASFIPEHDLYLYWIMKTADFPEVRSIVEGLRRAYPNAKHAAGGTHVDNFAKECERCFDTVVVGPGEESFISIINDCRKGSLRKSYRTDWSKVLYDDYPIARRDYLPESAIVNTALFEKYGGIKGTSAMFSRGCNFKCAYCVYNVPKTIQMRSPRNIEKEIQYLKKEYKIDGINLRDEICIPLSPTIAEPYLEAIGRCNVIWRGQTRVGASEKMLALACKTGCVELALGVESASQQVLDIISKGQKVEQARDFIQTCRSLGIKVKMCLILGLPGEPPDIVEITRSLIEEAKPDYVNISGFCPVPGSKIFDDRGHYGIKSIDTDWSKHAHLVFRFSDDEHFGLPFEYEKTNKWGRTFSRSEIIGNIRELQHYLQERGMSY
ncbi:MAG: radical SAM protein [Candidatus Omnitrophota bacterium]